MKNNICCLGFGAALTAITFALAGCGSDAVDTVTSAGSGSVVENIAEPVSEQDLEMARAVFDAGRARWDSFEPFAHTMTVGVETISELRLSFDAEGNLLSEEIVQGDPEGRDIESLPRSVDEAFDVVDDMILAFEEGRSAVPGEGECGHHLNARFDPEWGVPTQYDSLGPCDDGVGVVIAVTLPPASS